MAGALVTTSLGLGGIPLGLRTVVDQGMADHTLVLSPDDLDRCAAAPEHWSHARGLLRLTAHHPDGTSANPSVEPLDAAVVPMGPQVRHLPDGWTVRFWERQAIARIAQSGPCAVLHTRVDVGAKPVFGGPMSLVRLSAITGMFLGAIVAFLGVIWFAILPLLRRIRVLDEAAAQVGHPGTHLPSDPTDDALGRVGRTLASSHERILADRSELQARHVLLERHLAGVAHDLRTPIASVQLTLEALDADAPEGLHTELGNARMELVALEALADNLLQANRLRGGLDPQGDAQRVDLGEVCRRLGTRFGILGRARGIRVHAAVPDGDVWARCDPSLAERAIANLLHNAIVHGPPDHPIGISLDRSDHGFVLAVQSGGGRIAGQRLEALAGRRLTEPGPSRTRQDDGLGLGITNEVAERAGWSFRYSSPDDGGLRVELQGPLRADITP